MKKWTGAAPSNCDGCNAALTNTFYDARSSDGTGRWGNFCHTCFKLYTPGKLGVGVGQKYERNSSENKYFIRSVCVS